MGINYRNQRWVLGGQKKKPRVRTFEAHVTSLNTKKKQACFDFCFMASTSTPPQMKEDFRGAQQISGVAFTVRHQIGSSHNPTKFADGKGLTADGRSTLSAELVAVGELVSEPKFSRLHFSLFSLSLSCILSLGRDLETLFTQSLFVCLFWRVESILFFKIVG
jgi:hypothetical protein